MSDTPSQDQLQKLAQANQVLLKINEAVKGLATTMAQIETAHNALAGYTDPDNPDGILMSGNSREFAAIKPLQANLMLIGKAISEAGIAVSDGSWPKDFTASINDLANATQTLKAIKDALTSASEYRAAYYAHVGSVLDAWQNAHPNEPTDLPQRIRDFVSPAQVDQTIIYEAQMVSLTAQTIKSLSN
jgi:hypothetical protein